MNVTPAAMVPNTSKRATSRGISGLRFGTGAGGRGGGGVGAARRLGAGGGGGGGRAGFPTRIARRQVGMGQRTALPVKLSGTRRRVAQLGQVMVNAADIEDGPWGVLSE